MFTRGLDQLARRRRTVAVVDVATVRLVADRHHIRPQFMEDVRRNVVRRAMRAIQHDFHAEQVQIVRKRALAELDVAAGGILYAAGAAQRIRRRVLHRLFQLGFDLQLGLVRQLVAAGRELDAVVIVRVV